MCTSVSMLPVSTLGHQAGRHWMMAVSCGLDGTGAVQGAAKPSSESCRWWRLALSFCRDVEMRWEKQHYSNCKAASCLLLAAQLAGGKGLEAFIDVRMAGGSV